MSTYRHGFTRDEYFRAFLQCSTSEDAANMADSMMVAPDGAILSWGLLDALSLVSEDCAKRVQGLMRMTDEEARVRRDAYRRLRDGTAMENPFTPHELKKALAMVMSSEQAALELERLLKGGKVPVTPDIPVQLLDLLMLVSDDCAKRVQRLFGWNDEFAVLHRKEIEHRVQMLEGRSDDE
jgi:hypothetical protein